jgi:DNA repair protein RecN (Recombination protein N)
MLERLSIKNVAVIDSADVPFEPGLNILSGETGAGKSIVLESIGLILGSRANTDLIRTGCSEATVEGLFDLSALPQIRTRLVKLGFSADSSELLIKRSILMTGKHRIYVNGELATLTMLQELCEGLVDLCGQHEHQSLLKANVQLELIDRYGGLLEQVQEFGEIFAQHRSISKEIEALEQAEADRIRRSDFLSFQIQELKEASLEPQEDTLLSRKKELLQSAETRLQNTSALSSLIDSEEEGAIFRIKSSIQKAKILAQLDPSAQPILQGLERALVELDECTVAISRYERTVDHDPALLEQVQERLALIANLRRKYGSTVDEMLIQLSRLEGEYESLDQSSQRVESLKTEQQKVAKILVKLGKELSDRRQKASVLFSQTVTQELKDLKMGEARFSIEIERAADLKSATPSGFDRADFVIQTNRGDQSRPLAKVASGGELSRMMLAIRRVISDRGGIGVYLFDEIDAGIGGQTAFQVGRKLRSVASHNQVICITHLPQVASFADHHLSVSKTTQKNKTITQVHVLSNSERKEELARMLGGPELTKKSLDNASEMIKLATERSEEIRG